MMRTLRVLSIILAAGAFIGCETAPKKEDGVFQQYRPLSILVLPPTNNSVEVNAPYTYLSTISKPLAEKGYYVFPVAVIDQFLKENGMPTPDEMHTIPLDKIRQYIGADAVLYVSILDWGQKFQIVSSKAVVRAQARLVDTQSGTQIWSTNIYGTYDNSNSNTGGGLLGAVVGAVVDQISGSLVDHTLDISRTANYNALYNGRGGLPDGPYRDPVKPIQ